MVGTAYLDDEIWAEFKDDYAKIPVLSAQYPSVDALFAVDPDFIFGSYSSAFEVRSINYTKILGECSMVVPRTRRGVVFNATFCREELNDYGVDTYLQASFCENSTIVSNTTIDSLLAEIWEIATIFDVHDSARLLVDSILEHFDQASEIQKKANSGNVKTKVFWLDSWSESEPYVGACCGSVNLILQESGASNIFSDLGGSNANWASASWSEVVDKDPDVIVLADASWDSADSKILNLCNNSVTRNLKAVQNRAFISIPFSGSTLGVKVGAVAWNLAEAMTAVYNGKPLSSAQFSLVDITSAGDEGTEAVSSSGVKVYSKLPIVNGIDLDTFCPGTSHIVIQDPSPASVSNDETGITNGQIAGIVIGCTAFLVAVVSLSFLLGKRKGYSMMAQKSVG
jgi:iron complex transport system substrate-binding protein